MRRWLCASPPSLGRISPLWHLLHWSWGYNMITGNKALNFLSNACFAPFSWRGNIISADKYVARLFLQNIFPWIWDFTVLGLNKIPEAPWFRSLEYFVGCFVGQKWPKQVVWHNAEGELAGLVRIGRKLQPGQNRYNATFIPLLPNNRRTDNLTPLGVTNTKGGKETLPCEMVHCHFSLTNSGVGWLANV